jgi:hypothetical protein
MSPYKRDREWSEQFIPSIKHIVGPRLLVAADHRRDTRQATDLLIFTARDMRIAARVRRPGYAERYPWDFTIRAKRDSGAETELSKIAKDFGDWMFYGHAAESGDLCRWMIVSLHVWRWFWRVKDLRHHPDSRPGVRRVKWSMRTNKRPDGRPDGTHLACFNAATFAPYFRGLVIASSHALPEPSYGAHPTTAGMDRR